MFCLASPAAPGPISLALGLQQDRALPATAAVGSGSQHPSTNKTFPPICFNNLGCASSPYKWQEIGNDALAT